jgi:putative membrane protein (TIGR04086 family)
VIKPVNQFIKVISIFCGCFFSFGNKKGYLKGLLTGVLFAVISYVLFAILGGETVFGFSFLIDVFFCSAIGTILGILTVSIKK